MNRAAVSEEQGATKAGPAPELCVADALHAVLEAELRSAEAVGVSQDEPAHWLRAALANQRLAVSPGISELPATIFTTLSRSRTRETLEAFAARGKRVAFLGSETHFAEDTFVPARNPCVLHLFGLNPGLPSSRPAFQLIARTPQQSADFVFIARYLAEHLLVPGIVHHLEDFSDCEYDNIALPAAVQIAHFLGLPGEIIETPAHQRHVFGGSRRRVPHEAGEGFFPITLPAEDFFATFSRAAAAFAKLTNRKYGVLKAVAADEAEVLLVAPGGLSAYLQKHFEMIQQSAGGKIGLVEPVVLSPVPGQEYAALLQGRKAVLFSAQNGAAATSLFFAGLQEGMNRALINGTVRAGKKRKVPYPAYPAYAKPADVPRLHIAECATDAPALTAFDEIFARLGSSEERFVLDETEQHAPADKASPDHRRKTDLDLILHGPRVQEFARLIAERVARFLHFPYRLHGDARMDCLRLSISPHRHLQAHTAAAVDGLISLAPTLASLHQAIPALKKGATLLAATEGQDQIAFLQAVPAAVRERLRTGEIKLRFLRQPDAPQGAAYPKLDWFAGACFGGILKLLLEKFPGKKPQEAVHGVLKALSSNCDLNFAKAVQYGFEQFETIDAEAFAAALPALADEEGPVIREPAAETVSPQELEHARRSQLKFYLSGAQPATGAAVPQMPDLQPPQLFGMRNLDAMRLDYPLCVVRGESPQVQPLKALFDAMIAALPEDGDEARLHHDILLLEKTMKVLAGDEDALDDLWRKARDELLSNRALDTEKAEKLRQNLLHIREKLPVAARVYGCSHAVPRALMLEAWHQECLRKAKAFLDEIDELAGRLSEILQSDFSKSTESRRPDSLQAAVGSAYEEDLDFGEFSLLLAATQSEKSLNPERRKRIRNALRVLQKLQSFYAAFQENGAEKERLAVVKDCHRGYGELLAWQRDLVEFTCAVQIARLEIENKYDPAKHDAIFQSYSLENLDPEDFEILPPVPIHLDVESVDAEMVADIAAVLSTPLPAKILITPRRLFSAADLTQGFAAGGLWAQKLAQLSATLKSAFVLQASISDPQALSTGLAEGMASRGPALFCVYSGAGEDGWQQAYLDAAMALESRAFPAFVYDPSKGTTLAEQCSIQANPRCDLFWAEENMPVRTGDEETETRIFPFTVADYLALQPELSALFLPVPTVQWHDKMIPLSEFLRLDEQAAEGKLPYLQMVDPAGRLWRVLPSRQVVETVQACAREWQHLRELGGVDSSHVNVKLAEAREALETAKTEEIERIEHDYQEKLESAVGELAEDIVSNIAVALLDQNYAPAAPRPAPPPPAAPAAPAATAPEPEVAAEQEAGPAEAAEEETLILDEAYIETPRCTSCNDCTNRNSLIFAYDENKQAYIKDASAGPYRDIVEAAENCPVKIIHPGKPANPDEPGLEDLMKRAEPFM